MSRAPEKEYDKLTYKDLYKKEKWKNQNAAGRAHCFPAVKQESYECWGWNYEYKDVANIQEAKVFQLRTLPEELRPYYGGVKLVPADHWDPVYGNGPYTYDMLFAESMPESLKIKYGITFKEDAIRKEFNESILEEENVQ